MENTPSFLGKQFLQGKETITRPDMENMPVLLWNQSIQENEKNVHNKETLSTSLKMDTNMDTNYMAHRYRHTEKEVHLLSEPSELQPLKAMAHRYTEKETHLLSEPSELRPLKAMAH